MAYKKTLMIGAVVTLAVIGFRVQAVPALASTDGSEPFGKADALALVQKYDAQYFGGFFSTGGRSHKDVMAIFAVESGFNAKAKNSNDPSGAWGIGQMLATTARDFGVMNPTLLYRPEIAIKATMDYLKWAYSYLTNSLNHAPSRDEWIGSYNTGVGNITKGNIPHIYLLKWQTLRAFI